MKTSLVAIIAALIGMLGGAYIGAEQYSKVSSRNRVGAELRMHLEAYEETEGSHQLREYLKSRIYYLGRVDK